MPSEEPGVHRSVSKLVVGVWPILQPAARSPSAARSRALQPPGAHADCLPVRRCSGVGRRQWGSRASAQLVATRQVRLLAQLAAVEAETLASPGRLLTSVGTLIAEGASAWDEGPPGLTRTESLSWSI